MPNYIFDAVASNGSKTRGVIDAPTRSIAVQKILSQGTTPVRVVDETQASRHWGPASALRLPEFVSSSTRVRLLQEFSMLLKAGLSVERSLSTMTALSSSAKTKTALQAISEALRSGEPLSIAMRQAGAIFPEATRSLVAAGEASGRLPDVLSLLAESQNRAKQLTDKIISSMVYPTLLIVVMIAVLVVIFTTVLPQLEPMLLQSGTALPWPAAALLAVSHFFNAFGFLLAIVLITLLLLLLYGSQQAWAKHSFDRWTLSARVLIKIPLHYHGAQFCRNLSLLIESGMQLPRALETVRQTMTNTFIKRTLDVVIADVNHGQTLRQAMLDAKVFPQIATEFVAVGEETGRTGPMLNEAAEVLDRDVQTKLERLSSLLLPAVTIILGAIVAAIMSGVVSGILAANDLAL